MSQSNNSLHTNFDVMKRVLSQLSWLEHPFGKQEVMSSKTRLCGAKENFAKPSRKTRHKDLGKDIQQYFSVE